MADWSAGDSSPSRRPNRPRQAAPPAAELPVLLPADLERVAALLEDLTRGSCQLAFYPFKL